MKMNQTPYDLFSLNVAPNADTAYTPAPDMTSTTAPQVTDTAAAPSGIDWTKLFSTGLQVYGAVETANAAKQTAQAQAKAKANPATYPQYGYAPQGYSYNAAGQLMRTNQAGFSPVPASMLSGQSWGNFALYAAAFVGGLLLIKKLKG